MQILAKLFFTIALIGIASTSSVAEQWRTQPELAERCYRWQDRYGNMHSRCDQVRDTRRSRGPRVSSEKYCWYQGWTQHCRYIHRLW